ncbi:Stf0 family sulfotransferase [Kineosporia sp. A_224]|uniref:Stf0 family sulfotransferase n=1 Tax=Kineosporia sp. A_224 TaxID=1962180 RepID=UPI000B4ABAF4|nr:Stf0 family sulfotransferase [Kineosporia sp. A_224]
MSEPSGYLLCGTPRTGSTLLCSLLRSTGVLGRPESYFREPDEAAWARRLGVGVAAERAADYPSYVRAVRAAATTGNGVFAARVMWGSLDRVVHGLGGQPGDHEIRALEGALGPLVFVHLRRLDVVAQAVSWCRAEQTGYWQDGDSALREPYEDAHLLRRLHDTVLAHEAAWSSWFDRHALRPLEVSYEEIVAEPGDVVRRIAEHVGVVIPSTWQPVLEHRRQADSLDDLWRAAMRSALDDG